MVSFHITKRIVIALQRKTVLLKASIYKDGCSIEEHQCSSTSCTCAEILCLINSSEIT